MSSYYLFKGRLATILLPREDLSDTFTPSMGLLVSSHIVAVRSSARICVQTQNAKTMQYIFAFIMKCF